VPGQREGLHNWEFRHLLRLSKPTACELRKELGIRGTIRHLFIPRPRLEQFFRRRWVGNIDQCRSGNLSRRKKLRRRLVIQGRRKKCLPNPAKVASKPCHRRLKKKK
jgi:hypothetical protein